MFTEPRRSLRLRTSNLPIDGDRAHEKNVTVLNQRAIVVPNQVEKSAKKSKKREKNEVPEEFDVKENEGATISVEKLVSDNKAQSVRHPRKRGLPTMDKIEESNEEEVSKDENIPAKTRRIGQKAEAKVVTVRDQTKGMNKGTVVQSTGRPRRECVRKITVEQYDDLMSGSASSSDVTSSESDIDDSDLEKEIDKAKRRKGRRKRMKSSSESEEDEECDEEEEELDSDGPRNIRGRRNGPFPSRGCRRNGGSGRNIGKERKGMEMDLPVEILIDREYEVDYDEMVAWEAKSIKMVRDLRELERDRANGGQIMDTVNEFVQRCLKGGRMIEMDEKESVRVTLVHENELAEMNRKKNMTVTQRIKETMEKEKERLEKENDEESDEEEDEWEEMEPVDENDEIMEKGVEVRVDTKKKLNAPWKAKWIRQEVNREVKQRCENIHKAHIVSYIAHLRHLMALAKLPTRKDDGIPLSARSLSLIPCRLMSDDGVKITNMIRMEGIMEWWRKNFTNMEEKVCEKINGMNDNERMDELMENLYFVTSRDAVVLFSSLASHLDLPLRIVARCLVTTKKPKENISISKKTVTLKNKKNVNNEENERPLKEESIVYWCELWNEEERAWKVFDPFADSLKGEKGKQKKRRENAKKKDEKEMVNDFIKSWNSSTHLEPFRSCMEKDGPVIYFIAVDNGFSVRDVSSRYINGKDLISRDLKGRRANDEWLMELWGNKTWAVDSIVAKDEDNEWMEKMKKMDMPTTRPSFKDHPLFVLDKDVLKMQIIFPYDTKPIGEMNKYKIFLRKFVRPINTRKWYEKMGRQIKKDEPPCGKKRVTNAMSGESTTQGLYGYWQTEEWDGGDVEEGRIPRNEFGNVYLYQPEMIPRGCIYLQPEGLQRVATELKKDFVPAVIAWYYKGGKTIPLIRGAVFVKEDLSELLAAWRICYKRWKEEDRKARSDRCIARWRKLIKGMMRLAAMRKEFEPMDTKKKGNILNEDAVQKEEKASWPHNKYGGEMFEDD